MEILALMQAVPEKVNLRSGGGGRNSSSSSSSSCTRRAMRHSGSPSMTIV